MKTYTVIFDYNRGDYFKTIYDDVVEISQGISNTIRIEQTDGDVHLINVNNLLRTRIVSNTEKE